MFAFHCFAFRGRPPSLPFFLAAFAFAFDVTDPPSLPSAAAIAEMSFFFTLNHYPMRLGLCQWNFSTIFSRKPLTPASFPVPTRFPARACAQ
jgi:hypothetical protein